MFRVLALLCLLAMPCIGQSKISKVVAPGFGSCVFGSQAHSVEIAVNTWEIQFSSGVNGHDQHGWIQDAFLFVGARYDSLGGMGSLVTPSFVLYAGNVKCWGDLKANAPWLKNLRAYVQFVAKLPGCKNHWHAGPVLEIATASTPRKGNGT